MRAEQHAQRAASGHARSSRSARCRRRRARRAPAVRPAVHRVTRSSSPSQIRQHLGDVGQQLARTPRRLGFRAECHGQRPRLPVRHGRTQTRRSRPAGPRSRSSSIRHGRQCRTRGRTMTPLTNASGRRLAGATHDTRGRDRLQRRCDHDRDALAGGRQPGGRPRRCGRLRRRPPTSCRSTASTTSSSGSATPARRRPITARCGASRRSRSAAWRPRSATGRATSWSRTGSGSCSRPRSRPTARSPSTSANTATACTTSRSRSRTSSRPGARPRPAAPRPSWTRRSSTAARMGRCGGRRSGRTARPSTRSSIGATTTAPSPRAIGRSSRRRVPPRG